MIVVQAGLAGVRGEPEKKGIKEKKEKRRRGEGEERNPEVG